MSRHFYDLDQLLNSKFGNEAIKDQVLFESIIAHRRVFTPVKTTNYDSIELKSLNIIPPTEHLEYYKADYKEMQTSMIHGVSNDLESIIEKIQRNLRQNR